LIRAWLFALATALLVGLAGCGGNDGSPVQPAPAAIVPPTPSPIPPMTMTGHVTATNGGYALAGLAVDLGGLSTVTDPGGAFSYQYRSGTTVRLSLTGSSIVPRSLVFHMGATRDVTVDAIGVAGFDLNFYRALVRNARDAPSGLQPLRRWTRTPMIYLKTVDEVGGAIDVTTLATVEATAKESIPQWTSGRLGVPTVERGTDTREGQSGWLTIKFPARTTTDGNCGRALVGADGGWIELFYTRTSAGGGCRVGGTVVTPRTIRHEIGHALGFYHTGDLNDVLSGLSWPSAQSNQRPSARELAAAAIAYARPVGNTDPDIDPSGVVTLAPMSVR
jgi:hypothetical protein